MVRLVFRPYTQIPRWICTSQSLQASTRVSSSFTLFRHSSPSFGSYPIRFNSNCFSSQLNLVKISLSFRQKVFHFQTRAWHRLLGPCFKTGQFLIIYKLGIASILTFSHSCHPLFKVLFHLSLTVLVHYRSCVDI